MLDHLQRRSWRSLLVTAHTSSAGARVASSTTRTPARALSSSSARKEPLARPSKRRSSPQNQSNPMGRSQRRGLHFSHNLTNRPGPGTLSAHKATPLDEVTRLRELINRANATNSKLSKERILSEFDDLIPLLAFLYDPYCRLHVTSSTVHNYLQQRKRDEDRQSNQAPLLNRPSNRSRDKTHAAALRAKQEGQATERIPATLLELFHLLASRKVTGHEALAVIRVFLEQHGIIEQHEYALGGYDDPNMSTTELFRKGLLRPTSLEIFYRCLDRNLKGGFGERILQQAFAANSDASASTNEKGKNAAKQGRAAEAPIPFRGSFEVALGRTVTREELPSLFASKDTSKWYASRKLDGVRCLFVVRLQKEFNGNGSAWWKVASIQALSRGGRPFSTLAVLEKELASLLPSWPGLTDLLGDSSGSTFSESSATSGMATLILDGEVCILRPPEQASPSAAKKLDATISSAEGDPAKTEQPVVEDFAAVVGLIKRKNYTIPEPAFFPFDLLTLDEFTQWRSNSPFKPTFSQRLASLESLVASFEANARARHKQSLIRKLSQHVVSSTEHVGEMLATASQCGWEGLVLRQDVPYEGKRSSAIRKFKEWKDAEYTVQGITVAIMRLPINGRFEEREAMAAIQIEHKGAKVSVGSGFTPEQRVEFAKDPRKIAGKVVTVEYFDESTTMPNGSARSNASTEGNSEGQGDKKVYSLRFPRIKQIWGEERDI
ncbi:uncharacterized protein UDID_01802 [Ustilago sp. UG-2017a]|nr:uncharacterized protein UDID_01802 [Ustilago sp. UG-2017a]